MLGCPLCRSSARGLAELCGASSGQWQLRSCGLMGANALSLVIFAWQLVSSAAVVAAAERQQGRELWLGPFLGVPSWGGPQNPSLGQVQSDTSHIPHRPCWATAVAE